jgi:hypothetical protein
MMADAPRVFVSYSHDSEDHARLVLALTDALRQYGIDAILDQNVFPGPEEGWPRWMDNNLDAAKFILMVCTETYRRRVMGQEQPGRGLGVRWEGSLIFNRIYNDEPSGSRFIPILLPGSEPAHIPNPIQGHAYYRIATFDLTDPGFEALYRHLTDQPATPRPNLGPVKRLPPKPRPQPSPGPLPPAGGPWWNVPSQGNILTRRVVEGLSRQFGGGEPPVADRGTETPHEDTYLAPFLCDRNDQEVQLRRALASALAGRPGRPFVSIVHGSQDQCLDKFLERLTRVVLPSLLGRIQEETIDWPRSYQGPEHLHAWLTDCLAERFLPPEPATWLAGSGIAKVAQALAARRAPVAIQAFFNSEDWIAGGWAMLDAFLDYWSGWPDAPPGSPLLVILGLKYRTRPAPRPLLALFLRDRYGVANREARETIRSLSFTRYNSTGVVLDELKGIQFRDLEDWARDRRICALARSRDLLAGVGALWRKLGSPDYDTEIAMESLAPELDALLTSRSISFNEI